MKRDSLCRQLEQKYSLTVDNGRDQKSDKAINENAMNFEAQTGQESLFGYSQRHKPAILAALENSKSWSDCHRVFLQYGFTLKLHGNGLIIQAVGGKHSIKASGFDRSISKAKLEKRFGAFTSAAPTRLAEIGKLRREIHRRPILQRPKSGQTVPAIQNGNG